MTPSGDKHDDDDVEAVLRQTRADFVSGFRPACVAMARLIDGFSHDTNGAARSELVRLLHRMSGLAGTIGFPTVSLRARELEDLLHDHGLDQVDTTRAYRLLDSIRLGFERDVTA